MMALLPVALLFYLLQLKGIRITFDSQQFLCAAHSFSTVGKLVTCDGQPMVLSAVGYPVLLSFFPSPETAHPFLSLFFHFITVWVWLAVVRDTFQEIRYQALAACLLLFGLPLFFPFLFLWSEGLFLALFSVGFWGLKKFEEKEETHFLIWATAYFTFALTVRYAGMFVLFPLFFKLLYENWKTEKREAILLSFLPMVLVIVGMAFRNLSLTETLQGHREKSVFTVGEVIEQCAVTLVNWVLPSSSLGMGASVLVGAIAILSLLLERSALVWIFYWLCIVLSSSFTEVEHDERLFSVIYPLFVFSGIDILKKGEGTNQNAYIPHIIAVLWGGYVLARFCKNFLLWMN